MKPLSITLIQSNLHWENIAANLAMFEEKIWKIGGKTDVIILPEMFTTGFSMNAKSNAEMMNLTTTRWMKQMSAQTGALLLGSIIANEGGKYFNRLIWMEPDGTFKTYDKRHLFRMAEENMVYTAGKDRFVGSWKGWNICPLVCYDLRFPVWSRNRWSKEKEGLEYDLLIYVANWPDARVGVWDTLLKARAIENLSYVAGVNRVGQDGLNVPYSGHSGIYNPKGETLLYAGEQEGIITFTLDGDTLSEYRQKFPAWRDADDFKLE